MSFKSSQAKPMPFLLQALFYAACTIGGFIATTAAIDVMADHWATCAARAGSAA